MPIWTVPQLDVEEMLPVVPLLWVGLEKMVDFRSPQTANPGLVYKKRLKMDHWTIEIVDEYPLIAWIFPVRYVNVYQAGYQIMWLLEEYPPNQ